MHMVFYFFSFLNFNVEYFLDVLLSIHVYDCLSLWLVELFHVAAHLSSHGCTWEAGRIYKLPFCGTVYVTCMYMHVQACLWCFFLGACQNSYIVCCTSHKVDLNRYSPTVKKKHTFFCMQCTPVKHLCTCKISSSASRLGRTTPEMSFWKFQGQNRNYPHCLSFILAVL